MPFERQDELKKAPDWWKSVDYSFLETMPDKGWLWEFMRRAILRGALRENIPVEAMHLTANTDGIDSKYLPLFTCWRDLPDADTLQLFPPAASLLRAVPRRLGSPQRVDTPPGIEQYRPLHFVDIRVDLDRRDTKIDLDIHHVLRSARERYPEPTFRPNTRFRDFADRRVLQVWDLDQLGLKPLEILVELEGDDARPDKGEASARTRKYIGARKTARDYIEKGKWRAAALSLY
jgi:hypothetical protein